MKDHGKDYVRSVTYTLVDVINLGRASDKQRRESPGWTKVGLMSLMIPQELWIV